MSKRAYGIFGVSIGLSFLSLFLFYKTGLGINFAIYSFIIAVIILIIAKVFKRISKSLVLNSILLVVISIPFSITSALPVLIVLNILWFYHLIITIDSLTRITSSFGLINYIFTPIIQIVTAVLAPFSLLIKTKRNEKDLLNTIMRILIGVVIAIPIIVLFTYLLMSADLVFKDLIEKTIGGNIIKELFIIFLWFWGVTWLLLGILYHTLYKKQQFKPMLKIQSTSSSLLIETVTILIIVELLFLVFNIVQITYLFGGEKLITNGNFTYSEYARKGFFELLAVSVITMLLIGVLAKIKKTATKSQSLIFKVVSVSGLLLLMPMAFSAFYRLMMYEQEYGFTRLRLYSHLFIIYLIVILIWLGIKLTTHLRESKFLYVLYLFTIISLAIFALINVDGTIARLNIQKYKKDVTENKEIKLDIAYLSSLSYDAIDEIMNYYDDASDEDKKEIAFYMKPVKDKLEFEENGIDLRAFNFRRYKAKNRLKNEYLPNVSGVNSIDFYSQQVEDERKQKIISDYFEQYCNETQEGYYPTDEYLCNFEDYDFSLMADYSEEKTRIFLMSEYFPEYSYGRDLKIYDSKMNLVKNIACYGVCHVLLDPGEYYLEGRSYFERTDIYKFKVEEKGGVIYIIRRDK